MVFTCLQCKSFENTVGKGEIARNEQFLLSSQCFQPFWRTHRNFHQFRYCRLQTFWVWKSLKFVVWETVKMNRNVKDKLNCFWWPTFSSWTHTVWYFKGAICWYRFLMATIDFSYILKSLNKIYPLWLISVLKIYFHPRFTNFICKTCWFLHGLRMKTYFCRI